MSAHKFRVGQAVEYQPPQGFYAPMEVTSLLQRSPNEAASLSIIFAVQARNSSGLRRKADFAPSWMQVSNKNPASLEGSGGASQSTGYIEGDDTSRWLAPR